MSTPNETGRGGKFTILKRLSLYPILARYRCIKDIPKHETQFNPLALDFGLWGTWFVPRGPSGLICKDGSQMPFHACRLHSGEVLVGQRDLTAADGSPHEAAWRESMDSSIRERCQLPQTAIQLATE